MAKWTARLTLCAVFSILSFAVLAQGSLEDYERARNLRQTTRNKVYRDRVEANWLPGGSQFWYRIETGEKTHEFILVDAEKGERQPAFDHERLSEALKAEGIDDAAPDRLPIERLGLDLVADTLQFRAGDKTWECDLETYALTAREGRDESLRPMAGRRAPDRSRRTGDETAITFLNRNENEVTIYWLDAQGNERSYGTLAPGERRRQHTYSGHVWKVVSNEGGILAIFEAEDDPTTAVIPQRPVAPPVDQRNERRRRGPDRGTSPDGRWRAYIEDHNVMIEDRESTVTFTLTEDGTSSDSYGGRFYWSPDSQKLVVMRTSAGFGRKVYLIESSPDDQLQPKLHSYDYRKPGDRIPQSTPHLFHVAGRKEIPIDDALFPNPWSNRELRWSTDSSEFTFVYNQRGHQVLRVVGVNAQTGEARAVIDETSDTFVDYAFKQYTHYLDETGEIVWMSERDGWNHLYLYDAKTGCVKNRITRGEWVVRGVDRVDDEARQIWFRAGGIRPGQDPYFVHYCRIDFDGSNLVVLTEGNGTHSVDFSPDRKFFIDTWSRVDQPPVTELRRSADGSLVCELERADWSDLLATGWRAPEPFVAKGRDGKTDIYGVIFRPMNFDPDKSYPVIESIYAGPQSAYVPKDFDDHHGEQEMAELGFVVVKIDGMGTSHRSKAFHDVCSKNLVDAGLPDRIAWMKAAAGKYPAMDLTRVGVYGGSAGGQNALGALLTHGDFYKVAVADCGCHDNRMDKIWWNELWMGWPVGPHYEKQSNVTLAPNLTGQLLLIVGELDRNVDPASTMQVVDALIEADKDFDLLVMTGTGHGAAGRPYARRRQRDFFVRHLLNVEPRHAP